MEEADASSDMKLGLDLGLGLTKYEPKMDNSKKNKVFFLNLSIPLHRGDLDHAGYSSSSCIGLMQEHKKQTRKNGILSGCKEDDHDMNYSNDFSRKKLRLSKDQITLLEDSFGQHSTLTMAQKQELAEKLNLKSRQVEVWFQNRRARTKLKQTEIDCEFLKKKFERLSDENRRLHKQLLDFRSEAKMEKVPPPPLPILHTSVAATAPSLPILHTSVAATAPSLPQLFHQMPKESVIYRTCSSCDKILKSGGDSSGGRKKEAAAVDAGTEVINED